MGYNVQLWSILKICFPNIPEINSKYLIRVLPIGGYANPGYTTGPQYPQYNATPTTGYPVVGTPDYPQKPASYQQYSGSENIQQQMTPTSENTTPEEP